MWKDGASLGPTPHSVLRGPTKAHWYTDKHGTFSTPTQTKALLCSSAFICSWQSVFNSEGKISNYLLVHRYLVTLITQQPPWNTKQHPFNTTAENLKPYRYPPYLYAGRVLVIILLLTPWYQMASVIPTDKSHKKDIREGLQGFFLKLATQHVWKALPKKSFTGKFWISKSVQCFYPNNFEFSH